MHEHIPNPQRNDTSRDVRTPGFVKLSIGVVTVGLVAASPPALAQIVPDNTLGAEGSRLTPDILIRGELSDRIDGGALRGSNLFHSFEQFNVNDLQRVYFANPAGIENILSRVTGTDVSDIFGTLGVDGTANLFLLNPNGIIFGENARLDIAGSFVASTGDRFTFPDGSEFSATNPQAPPLLTVNVPIGLQSGAAPTGNITNDGILYAGQDLTFNANTLHLEGQLWAGGDLTLRAYDTLQIRDSLTAPFIAAAQGEMLVQGDRTVDIFALNHPDSGLWSGGNMTLRSANPVGGDAHYYSGGNFRIEQFNGQTGNLLSLYDPIILSTGNVEIGDYTGASLHILASGSITLGNIEINAVGTENDTINPNNPDPFLANLATDDIPDSVNGGQVDGSRRFVLDARAGVDWEQLGGFPCPQPNVVIEDVPGTITPTFADPTEANITLDSFFTGANSQLGGIVFLTNHYKPNALPSSTGIDIGFIDSGGQDLGGSVTVESRSTITLNEGIISSALDLGSSGDVIMRAQGDIFLEPESFVNSSSITNNIDDPVGDISLESANGSITLNQATIETENLGTELSGDIEITAMNVNILGSQINADGILGLIDIEALNGSVTIDQSEISVESDEPNEFAGDIVIDASDRIDILNGSNISANGNFGLIFIGTEDITPVNVNIDNSIISATNENINGAASSGDIEISATGLISLQNEARVDTTTVGEGLGGSIFLDANQVTLTNATSLLAQTLGSGAAGRIEIEAAQDLLLSGSFIATGSIPSFFGNVTGTGSGGDILVTAETIDLTDISILDANTYGNGAGGDVALRTQHLNITGGSEVLAQTFGAGDSGDITVEPLSTDTPSTIFISGTAPLTFELVSQDDGTIGFVPRGGFSSGLFATTEAGATGAGGSIEVGREDARISDLILADGGVISARTRSVGNGQDITVNVDRLNITNGGQILTASLLFDETGTAADGVSRAGNISINAAEYISISGYDALYNSRFEGLQDGFIDAGFTDIEAFQQTRSVVDPVSPSSGLQASDVFGFGSAGNITVITPNLKLFDLASIDATTRGNIDAGNIILQTQRLSIIDGATVTALTLGGFSDPRTDGFGNFVFDESGSLIYEASLGNAGNIFVLPLDPNSPSSILITGTAPFVLPDGEPGGFSSGLLAATERFFFADGTDDGLLISTEGQGGEIFVGSEDAPFSRLTLEDGAVIGARSRSLGNAGNVTINIGRLNVQGGSQIISTAFGQGDAGDVTVNASGRVRISGVDPTLGDRVTAVEAALFIQLVDEAIETGTALSPEAADLQVTDNARGLIDLVGFSDEDGNTIAPSGIQSRAEFGEESPRSGNISLTGQSIALSDGAEINSESNNSTEEFSTIGLSATNGPITLNSSTVSTTNSGTGFAGLIVMTSPTQIRIDNGSGVLNEGNFGFTLIGDIDETNRIRVRGGSQIRADNENAEGLITDTFTGEVEVIPEDQNAGFILLQASDRIVVTGRRTRVSSDNFNEADAGIIFLEADSLLIDDRAQVSTSTFRRGNAGSISLTADSRIDIQNRATVFTTVEQGAQGDGGRIDITTAVLSMANRAQLQTQINEGAQGDAGSVLISVSDTVSLDNDVAIFSSIGRGASGQGGSIFVGNIVQDDESFAILPTQSFSATNGSQLIASTAGTGNSQAGQVFIVADEVLFDGISDAGFPSAVFSGVDVGGQGIGGDVLVIGGAEFSENGVESVTPSSSLTVSDGAVITVSSFGRGDIGGSSNRDQIREAGDVTVAARFIDMDDQGQIVARTGEGDGGNILLTELDQVLLMRSSSRISTTAGVARRGGDGGDITILAEEGFVVGEPFGNDDITSDAFLERGGQIEITARGIVGMIFRSRENIEQELGEGAFDDPDPADRIPTSDITAISLTSPELNGEVRVNAIDFNSSSIVQLPSNFVDGADLVAQVCPTGPGAGDRLGNFSVTGRGGLPPGVEEILGVEDLLLDWVTPPGEPVTPSSQPEDQSSGPDGVGPIVEAQGWRRNHQGQVVLVADTASGGRLENPAGLCP